MTDRSATTVWEGELLSGKGQVRLDTSGLGGTLDVSWPARIEEPGGLTSPEELVAAAHSACFSMALAKQLADGGHPPQRTETTATVSIEKEDAGWTVTRILLRLRATVPGIDEAAFQEAAAAAKDGCPISRLVKGNAEVTVDAQLA
jgi:lipoyl-dependent peroxiredoxin